MKKELWSDWKFAKISISESDSPDLLDAFSDVFEFTEVTIPHDWLIYDTKNLYESSIGIYQRDIVFSESELAEYSAFYLYFEGVYQDSTIYINGEEAFNWKYGYSSFWFDIRKWIRVGKNQIRVKVVFQAPNSRWYSGAGIYRPVWLLCKRKDHILPWGTYNHNTIEDIHEEIGVLIGNARAEFEICCSPGQDKVREVTLEISSPETVHEVSSVIDEEGIGVFSFLIKDVVLWTEKNPFLYNCKLSLRNQGIIQDIEEFKIGFRKIMFSPSEGLFVNDEKTVLHGVCEHHDLGGLGAAYFPSAMRRRVLRLKKMGCNAIRTAHNMPSENLLEICDELGVFVVDEAFDMWRRPKTQFDYARFFESWSAQDVKSWIKRDRNHASVILWSIGNEIYDTHAGSDGLETMEYLLKEVAKYDPKENAKATFGSNYLTWMPTQSAADVIKLVGYNYTENLYDQHHQEHPDWVIYGSETGSIVQSRGIYHFPIEEKVLADDDLQCSSLGNSVTSWGAKSIEALLEKEAQTPYSLGQFLWSGHDYIGEPTPYHTKNSYFGQIDTAGFPKDAYYHFRACWVEPKRDPFVHVFPHWDWNPGQIIDVVAVSNGATVDLQLNGQNLGVRNLDREKGKVVAKWKVPFEPGKIICRSFSETGECIAVSEQNTSDEPYRLKLECAERSVSSEDLLFVEVQALDKNDLAVSNARNVVHISVTGPGQLLALDNGDSTDLDSYQSEIRSLFSGKLLAIIAPTGFGSIEVTATSSFLKSANIVCEVSQAKVFRDFLPRIESSDEAFDELPVRKFVLRTDVEKLLTPENPRVIVNGTVLPEKANPNQIVWQITNRKGVESKIVQILEQSQSGISFKCIADGDLIVRALVYVRQGCPPFISSLEFRAEGFGEALIDPYTFFSASAFTDSFGEVGNGNERGISTVRASKCWVAYRNIDFGQKGTQKISIPIFSFNDETRIRIWKGLPYEKNSRVIHDKTYVKKSIWNTYQTYNLELDEKLNTRDVFAIETEDKSHIKGFLFMESQPSYEVQKAINANQIYGDQFEARGGLVTRIGNNVTFRFEDMDFSDRAVDRISICGQTDLSENSIHLVVEKEGETYREILEFPHSDFYQYRNFSIRPIQGVATIQFVFLPGSDFNFDSFQFTKKDDKF